MNHANLLYKAGGVIQFHLRHSDLFMHQGTFQAVHLILLSAGYCRLSLFHAGAQHIDLLDKQGGGR